MTANIRISEMNRTKGKKRVDGGMRKRDSEEGNESKWWMGPFSSLPHLTSKTQDSLRH